MVRARSPDARADPRLDARPTHHDRSIMSLRPTGTRITSDEVDAVAERQDNIRSLVALGDPETFWTVTTQPGRRLDYNQAISAMTLAEELARPNPNELLVESLRGELR